MPAQEPSLRVDGSPGGDQPQCRRRHREAMASNTSPKGTNPRADLELTQRDDAACWDQELDEAAGLRARRLLSRSNSRFYAFGDRLRAFRRWLAGERWIRRLAIAIASLLVIFTGCFGGLW